MSPILLPLIERAARVALGRSGIQSRYVATPIGALHAYDAPGSGALPTLVLFHGIGSTATPFAPLILRLRKHFSRVVAFDFPGHGFSEDPQKRLTPEVLYEAVAHALDVIVPEPALVAGNSLGGAVALHHAVTRPERVRALILLSPAGAQATDEEWAELRRAFAVTNRREARVFLDRVYHRTPLLARALAHEVPGSFHRPAIVDLLATATNEHAPSPEQLRALAMPVLFLWGRSERLLPERHFEYFRQHLPAHAIIERPQGFGHCPHFDRPGELARRIADFARKDAA